MQKLNKRNGFAFFNAIQRNERWGWSAITPNMDKVVINIWQDEMMGGWGSSSYFDTQELDSDPSTWPKCGHNDRVKKLKHASDLLDGILYILIAVNGGRSSSSRRINYCYPWLNKDNRAYRMKITHLDEKTGHFRVEYHDTVSVDWTPGVVSA